jgi:hypothetical protein
MQTLFSEFFGCREGADEAVSVSKTAGCGHVDVVKGLMEIVSGGQTGVDRAAWDAALVFGLDRSGWVPRGRVAEDGVIPDRYRCLEARTSGPAERTRLNVVDSHATLILGFGELRGGTALTIELCGRYGKPHLHLDLDAHAAEEALSLASNFLRIQRPSRLNVAGPRASDRWDVSPRAYAFLCSLFRRVKEDRTGLHAC